MRKCILLGFVFIMLFLVSSEVDAQENNSFEMIPFNAEAVSASFLEDEAAISAYGQVSVANLDLAENAFKTVEKKTDQYIVGSVALDDYPESDDVHVYVDISGWIISYYLSGEKVSKIIDWKEYSGGEIPSSKLEDALIKICAEMYQLISSITYYDFRHPNATHIMIITDEISKNGTESFRIMVPATHFVYSRTWSHAQHYARCCTGSQTGNIKIDEELLNSGTGTTSGWKIWGGDITPLQLYPDVFHEVTLYNPKSNYDSFVGIVIIYVEP